jgi:tryptophan synthase alpha chain
MASSRISTTFAKAKAENRVALMPYMVPGHPSLEASAIVIDTMIAGGADLIEIGIPFSDPLADGTTIQRVAFKALENGMTPHGCMQFAREARQRHPETPLIFMTYLNPVIAYGPEAFARDAAAAGIDGVILTDVPPEEAEDIQSTFRDAGLDLIFLVAPTSSDHRIQVIAEHAGGFIYCVSVTGVTGARSALAPDLPAFLARVRRCTGLPLAVGFGISRRDHIESLRGLADGAVVGSALMALVDETPPDRMEQALRDSVETLAGRRKPESIA